MSKITLLCAFLIGMLTANAENYYSFLTFETTDGAKYSVVASPLTLSFQDNVLMVGEHEFIISNLSKMYFTTDNESTNTNIDRVIDNAIDEAEEIYDLNGRLVHKTKLSQGVYIVKMKNGFNKIVVK